jgi:hypothetical protein
MPTFKLMCVQVISRAVWVEIEAERENEAALLIQTRPYRVSEVIKEHVDAIVYTGEAVALMKALGGTEET